MVCGGLTPPLRRAGSTARLKLEGARIPPAALRITRSTLRARRPAFRPRRAGDGTPVDVAIDARRMVSILLCQPDLRLEMRHQILAVEEGVLRDTGNDE